MPQMAPSSNICMVKSNQKSCDHNTFFHKVETNSSVFNFPVQEYEHLDWDARMRILMGTAYCLLYMHELNPPIAVANLTSNDILLTDDYAAKVGIL